MIRTVTGLFKARGDAERAVEHLVQELGIDRRNLDLRASADARSRLSLPAGEQKVYDEALAQGHIVISAEIDEDRVDRARAMLEECGAAATRTRSGMLL